MRDYIYVFVHIHKTAGATVVKHLRENFEPGERVSIQFPELRFNGVENTYQDYLVRCQEYFSRFSRNELKNIKVIHGHQVPYGVHTIVGRPARYITIFRDPDKRTMSFYNYLRTRYERETILGKKQDQFSHQLLINNKTPAFEEWVEERYAHPELWVNTTYQFLNTLGYIKSGKDTNKAIDEMLKKFYFVGIVESSEEDLNYIFYLLGISRYFLNQNVSISYITTKDQKECLKTLKKKNKLDNLIYKKALATNSKYKKTCEGFKRISFQIQRKRRYAKYVHHLLHDPKNLLIETSGLLRSRSKIYLKVFDALRGG